MISPRRYHQVLDLARELYSRHPAEIDYGVMAQVLQDVLECPVCVFSEVGMSKDGALGVGWPTTRIDASEITAVTLRNMRRHPLIRHYVKTSDRRPLTVTDRISLREWKSSEAGSDIYAAVNFYDHIAIPLDSPPGTMRSFALGRDDGPFTDQERELILALHPLLIAMDGKARRLQQQRPTPLTITEGRIMHLVRDGLTSRQIGIRLNRSHRTVEKHLGSIYGKLGVTNRIDAVNAFTAKVATGEDLPAGPIP